MHLAYIGPGSGLSAVGALLALALGLLVAFVAFVWYPLRRLRRKLRARDQTTDLGTPDRATKS